MESLYSGVVSHVPKDSTSSIWMYLSQLLPLQGLLGNHHGALYVLSDPRVKTKQATSSPISRKPSCSRFNSALPILFSSLISVTKAGVTCHQTLSVLASQNTHSLTPRSGCRTRVSSHCPHSDPGLVPGRNLRWEILSLVRQQGPSRRLSPSAKTLVALVIHTVDNKKESHH